MEFPALQGLHSHNHLKPQRKENSSWDTGGEGGFYCNRAEIPSRLQTENKGNLMDFHLKKQGRKWLSLSKKAKRTAHSKMQIKILSANKAQL